MSRKTNLSSRAAEARASARFGKVVKRDRDGRVTCVIVPGHEASHNEVIIRRDHGGMSFECRKVVAVGHIPCPGNKETVCYHALAAFLIAVGAVRPEFVAFCASEAYARLLARTGGEAYSLHSWEQAGGVWALVKR